MEEHPSRRAQSPSCPGVFRVGLTGVLALAFAGALAGCGSPAAPEPAAGVASAAPADHVPAGYEGRFRTVGTVLESPEHGPQLCHSVEESLPPQCAGVDVAGWDWSAVEAESASGTTWGSYVLVGTYDGTTFTLTEPAVVDDGAARGSPPEGGDFATPCPRPEQGWTPVDPERATEQAFQAAVQRAETVEGFGGLWIDQGMPEDQISEATANDPRRIILNVTTTGDPTAMEDELREVWGGSLCVTGTSRNQEQLLEIQAALHDVPGLLSSSPDVRTGQVDVGVLVATEEVQRELDRRFGAGAVRLHGALVPVD